MPLTPLRKSAIAWCVLMAVAIAASMLPTSAPLVLTVVFAGVWLFGAAMLWQFPRFGAVGTALYGVVIAVDLVAMHGWSPLNVGLALGSLVGTVLSVLVFLELRRR